MNLLQRFSNYVVVALITAITFFSYVDHSLAQKKTLPSELNGKTIRKINIVVKDIFEGSDLNSLYRTANDLKYTTSHVVIERELLFEVGDSYDEFLVRESERIIRRLKYLRNVRISAQLENDEVDLTVTAQDTWTLIPQFSFSSGDGRGRTAVGLAESDLMGLGKRLEVLYREDDGQTGVETVYEDNRVLGSDYGLLAAVFDRNDGNALFLEVSKPFRALVDEAGWTVKTEELDEIGRLYQAADTEYIYRTNQLQFGGRLARARGNPKTLVRRFSLGFDYIDKTYDEATPEDYETIDLDPDSVSHDPDLLATDRKFIGPSIGFSSVQADYVSMNFIDRFARVEDYNMGQTVFWNAMYAPEELGSDESALLLEGGGTNGYRLGGGAFLRAELDIGTRLMNSEFENSLISTEINYYNVLGELTAGGLFLGKHTLAVGFLANYGDKFDRDRQLLLGGDNGLRGYEARTFAGDTRVVLNLEDRVHLVEDAFQLIDVGASAFIDVGGATYDSFGDLVSNEIYSDVGVGLRLAFPRSSGSRVVRFDIAVPMRDGPDGSGAGEPRFLVSGGQVFSSFLPSERGRSVSTDLGVTK